MSEIKVSLAKEAIAGEVASTDGTNAVEAAPTNEAPAKSFLSGWLEHGDGGDHGHGHAPADVAKAPAAVAVSAPAQTTKATAQQHSMTVTLKPGEAAEIKLAMRKES